MMYMRFAVAAERSRDGQTNKYAIVEKTFLFFRGIRIRSLENRTQRTVREENREEEKKREKRRRESRRTRDEG